MAQAPTPAPTPFPLLLYQDAIDFLGRTSAILGSGARAMGMGGAFLARADDATAASWNPAGLSYLRRPELSLVGGWNTYDEDLVGDSQSRFHGFSPDFAAATFPFSVGRVSGSAQLSYQRVFPFDGIRLITREPAAGLEEDAAQEYDEITYDGGFDVITLATGWSLSRKLRLGVAVNRWQNGYDQDTFRFRELRPREIRSDWKMRGLNLNLGLIFSPVENLNLALVGNTPFTMDVELGKSRTDFRIDGSTLVRISEFGFESDQVTIDFPGAFGTGLSWRIHNRLTLSADYTQTRWSKAFIYNYYVVQFGDDPPSPNPALPQSSSSSIPPPAERVYPKLRYPYVTEFTQVDSEQIRLGGEYVLIFGKVKVPVRAGYFNDRQIRLDRDGEAPRYNGFTAGTGVSVGPVLVDAAYLYEYGSYVRPIDDVKVEQRASRFLISLIYRHGGS